MECGLGLSTRGAIDLIRASIRVICDKHSASAKITTQLDHISHCKVAPGTNWSNRWTNREFLR